MRDAYEIKPICKVLPISPSTCYLCAARRADPAKALVRVQRDARLCVDIQQM